MKSILKRHSEQQKDGKSSGQQSTSNKMDKFHSVVLEAMRAHRYSLTPTPAFNSQPPHPLPHVLEHTYRNTYGFSPQSATVCGSFSALVPDLYAAVLPVLFRGRSAHESLGTESFCRFMIRLLSTVSHKPD